MTDIPFYSKRNQVYPVLRQGRTVVEKHFISLDDWQKERDLYSALSGRISLPELLAGKPGLLVLEYKNHPTLLSELERQERDGFDAAPWKGLAAWLERCYRLRGQLPRRRKPAQFSVGWTNGTDHWLGFGGVSARCLGAVRGTDDRGAAGL